MPNTPHSSFKPLISASMGLLLSKQNGILPQYLQRSSHVSPLIFNCSHLLLLYRFFLHLLRLLQTLLHFLLLLLRQNVIVFQLNNAVIAEPVIVTSAPRPLAPNVFSANATANPPSDTSCAD